MQKINQYAAKQNGAALIIFTVVLSLFVLIFAFKTLNGKELEAIKNDKTAKALFEAKNALLGWTVIRGATGVAGMPGQLPCPEDTTLIGTPNEGNALSTCNSALPVIGRLPWKTLGLGNLRDGNGDKLWYVLSSGFRNSPINSMTTGQMNVNGVPNAAVAIIFSPGLSLAGQTRPTPTSASAPLVSDYLDLENGDGDVDYSTNGPINTFNDQLLLISQAELFRIVERRILRQIRGDNTQGLVKYFAENANIYPYADTDGDGFVDSFQLIGSPSYQGINTGPEPDNLFFNTATRNMLVNNNWMTLVNYQVSADRLTASMTINGQVLNLP